MPRIASTEVVVPKSLSVEERQRLTDALYAVHQQIFDGVERESFAKYVVESKAEQTWIQVHKNDEGDIVGYFAMHVFEKPLNGVKTAVFRAEAGSLRAYRGANTNTRFGLALVLKYLLRNPGRPTYYMGSLVHPSSYSLLAKYCGDIWPRREQPVPPELLAFMDGLATEFGLEKVDAANPLLRQVGWRTRESEVERDYWRQCDKPSARFFVEANPGYVDGHGLVTLVPATVANILSVMRVLGGRTLRKPVDGALSLARRLPGGARLRRSEVARRLKASPLFARFDTKALESLAARAQVMELPAGRYVFRKGDTSDELYLLARGAAYVLAEDGGEDEVVNQLGSGTVFGEIGMLAGERRSASVRTAAASTVVRIPRAALLPLLEADAELRRGVWSTFAERRFDDLVRGMDRYAHLGRKARLAWLLRGEQVELAAGEERALEPGSHLLMLTGAVELSHAAPRMTVRGTLLLEVERPLRVVAQEGTRLVVLPRLSSPELLRAVEAGDAEVFSLSMAPVRVPRAAA
ncbi:cyclic nucleotide-binding domain-containing protein [Myxococcus sp. RHSTA-1-4]|uniref:cyclic nucleotide-binding domain-containing protein n=1 Tax=Myxococcus sp. RHSTA-1-4 TaxID=2874601 RepID=UPI001CBC43FD|nr:cyclic nucleotide-binding domain-containing protein [Myxococcus sp. RHSTA-1-4]MBZ4417477.1 cyclic nucleotide-binding domain-containing protein [Myxococcus sp. RHSTA-1-4]